MRRKNNTVTKRPEFVFDEENEVNFIVTHAVNN